MPAEISDRRIVTSLRQPGAIDDNRSEGAREGTVASTFEATPEILKLIVNYCSMPIARQ